MIPLRVTFTNVICVAKSSHVNTFCGGMFTTTKRRRHMTRIWTKGLGKHRVPYVKKSKQWNDDHRAHSIIELYFLFRITIKNLRVHIKTVHENRKKTKQFVCTVCGRRFSAASGLAQHAITHEDFETSKIQCEVCGKWLKNKNILRSHSLTHSTSAMKCPHCPKTATNKHALSSHISLTHSVKKYQCSICPKSFSRPMMLRVCFWQFKKKFNKLQF